jgi:hypothetical protein
MSDLVQRPTQADEPPWSGWYSCPSCYGWHEGEPVAFESGDELCPTCVERDALRVALREIDNEAQWLMTGSWNEAGTRAIKSIRSFVARALLAREADDAQ